MNRTSILSCCLALVFCSSAQAQAQVIDPVVRRGPLSGVGSILTLEKSTRPPATNTEKIYLKGVGDQSQQPSPWPLSGGQIGNYSMQSLFPKYWPEVELDAISTGNAQIATLGGVPQLVTQWAAVTISVTNSAVGTAGNGWLERRTSGQYPNRMTPGADLVTHYFQEGLGIDPTFLGRTYVSQLAEHQGFNDEQDTDSLDVAMGVIASGTGEASRLMFLTVGEFYFSLTPASAAALYHKRIVLDSSGVTWVHPNQATIYVCEWDAALQAWGTPREYLTPEQLQLNREEDNIDAIDVSSGSAYVVFSTQPHAERSQLRVFEGADGEVYDLLAEDAPNATVTDRFGLRQHSNGDEGDDVDAVCFFDPEQGQFDNLLGTAVPGWTPHSLGLSVVRKNDGSYLFQVTGKIKVPGSVSGAGHPGGQAGLSSYPAPRVKIFTSWDFAPWATSPNGGTWTQVKAGVYAGEATEFHGSPPPHNYPEETPIFFRADVFDGRSGALLKQSWVSALDI